MLRPRGRDSPETCAGILLEHYELAQLSRELAAICTDSPVEFSCEDAKVGDLYTKEAYELCRKLDFRSFLNRFDPALVNEDSMEQDFLPAVISRAARLFLRKRRRQKRLESVSWRQEGTYGLGLALNEDEIYYIPVQGMTTPGYLSEKLKVSARIPCFAPWM